MKEETLLKLSFVGSLIFLFLALFFYENLLFTEIAKITKAELGKFLCIFGNFTLKKEFKSCILGKISDKTGEINVFVCNYTNGFEILKRNKFLENIKICGKIKEYRGSFEIIPSKIYLK